MICLELWTFPVDFHEVVVSSLRKLFYWLKIITKKKNVGWSFKRRIEKDVNNTDPFSFRGFNECVNLLADLVHSGKSDLYQTHLFASITRANLRVNNSKEQCVKSYIPRLRKCRNFRLQSRELQGEFIFYFCSSFGLLTQLAELDKDRFLWNYHKEISINWCFVYIYFSKSNYVTSIQKCCRLNLWYYSFPWIFQREPS